MTLFPKIRKRCDEATEGPWFLTFEDPEGFPTLFLDREKERVPTVADLNFADASRTDIPLLLQALDVAVEALEDCHDFEKHEGVNNWSLTDRQASKTIAAEALQKIKELSDGSGT